MSAPPGDAAGGAAAVVPPRGLEYTDTDGTVMEWDAARMAYFPKLDTSQLAQYQMGYGTSNAWQQCQTPEGHTYYYNASTGQSTWEVPAEFMAAMSAAASAAASGGAVQPLSYDELVARERIQEYSKAKSRKGSEGDDDDDDAGAAAAAAAPAAKKAKKEGGGEGGGFFKLDSKDNAFAYVSGLPTEGYDLEQFKAFMSKCGIIREDAEGNPKIKLYTTEDGALKGDGRCCYLKPESVDLAITLLDQSEIAPGHTVTVKRADFAPSAKVKPAGAAGAAGAAGGAKKKKPGKGKSDKDAKRRQEKRLLAWHDDEVKEVRKKAAGVVVIKNMFDPKEFDEDATYLNDIRDDLHSECGKFGVVKRVLIFDKHPEGVVSVKFEDVPSAHACIEVMNGRMFAGRRLSAELWDGHTSYKVEESDLEREARLKKWEQDLEKEG